MTHYCQPCNTYYAKDEVSECSNCGRILCMDCLVDEENGDERECGCPPLCEMCRGTEEDGAKCHFCGNDGCPLCLSGGCNVCNKLTDNKSEVQTCDECLDVCDKCNESVCPMHLLKNKLPLQNAESAEENQYCLACITKSVDIEKQETCGERCRKKSKKSEQKTSSSIQ